MLRIFARTQVAGHRRNVGLIHDAVAVRTVARLYEPPLNGLVTIGVNVPGGVIRSHRAALRAAAKQGRAIGRAPCASVAPFGGFGSAHP